MIVRKKIPVDSDTWDKFKKFVEEKNGKLRGALAEEVNNALVAYMHSKDSSEVSQIKSRTLRIVDAIAEEVVSQFQHGRTVSRAWIEDWIRVNITPVPKTIKKYSQYFSAVYTWSEWPDGYIKPWTFHRKMGRPAWGSEQEYLNEMGDRVSKRIVDNNKKEEEETYKIFNAEIIKD